MDSETLKKNKHDIMYRPELDYDKSYDTIGFIDEYEENTEDISSPAVIDELKDKINGVNALIQLLPSDIQEIAKKPLEALQHVIGDIDTDPEKLPSIEEIITYNPIKENVLDDSIPNSPFRDEEDPINIEISTNNKTDIIKKEYEYDLVSIIDDYIDKLDKALNDYLQNMLTLITGESTDLFSKLLNKYNINTSTISTNYKHLSDLIIRSQISRNMKAKMYNKLFNIDKTITHIRMCKVGVQQRLRYYEASYSTKKSLDDTVGNKFLEASRKQYDQKYNENFINLYKYLNSSVMVLTECMNQFINEAHAKIILHKKEGVKL